MSDEGEQHVQKHQILQFQGRLFLLEFEFDIGLNVLKPSEIVGLLDGLVVGNVQQIEFFGVHDCLMNLLEETL
jgi:hypothetical protein